MVSDISPPRCSLKTNKWITHAVWELSLQGWAPNSSDPGWRTEGLFHGADHWGRRSRRQGSKACHESGHRKAKAGQMESPLGSEDQAGSGRKFGTNAQLGEGRRGGVRSDHRAARALRCPSALTRWERSFHSAHPSRATRGWSRSSLLGPR